MTPHVEKHDDPITSGIIDHFLSFQGRCERLPIKIITKPVIYIQKPYLTLKLRYTNFYSRCEEHYLPLITQIT